MLELSPQQFEAMGQSLFRENLANFLRMHVAGMAEAPQEHVDALIEGALERCTLAGIQGQRAIAAYALASALFGEQRLARDPAVAQVLADVDAGDAQRAALLALWTLNAYRHAEREETTA